MSIKSGKRTIVLVVLLVVVVLWSLVLSACGGAKPNPLPVPGSNLNPAYRGLVALDVEIDTPPLYNLGHEAAVAVARSIENELVRINTGGSLIVVCVISSHSFEDCPVSFQIPPIPAFTLPPQPPHCGNDPYACSAQKKAYGKALTSWQGVHAREVKNLEHIAAWVHTQTDRIRSLKFRFDDKGSDIFGALATASQNFQGINASKYLIMATDFVSTTTRQDAGSFSLAGVQVAAIFRTCSDNAFCSQSNSYWSNVVRNAHALSFRVYSPAQSQAFALAIHF
jgi:hypothetical protein